MARDAVINAIEGQVCWHGWQGYGSVFFLYFGPPILEVVHDRVLPFRNSRSASVRGTWIICVEYCSWRITRDAELLAHWNSSRRRIARALDTIRGQVFLGAERHRGTHVLDFDLGTRITMRPFRDVKTWPLAETTLWYAHRADGPSQAWLADGTERFR